MCATRNDFLIQVGYQSILRSVKQLADAQLRATRRVNFSSSKEKISSTPRILGGSTITVSAGPHAVATIATLHALVPPIAGISYIIIWAFVALIDFFSGKLTTLFKILLRGSGSGAAVENCYLLTFWSRPTDLRKEPGYPPGQGLNVTSLVDGCSSNRNGVPVWVFSTSACWNNRSGLIHVDIIIQELSLARLKQQSQYRATSPYIRNIQIDI